MKSHCEDPEVGNQDNCADCGARRRFVRTDHITRNRSPGAPF
jgi:hypothetical protein